MIWTKVCVECGETFRAIRSDARRCSSKCRKRAHDRRRRIVTSTRFSIDNAKNIAAWLPDPDLGWIAGESLQSLYLCLADLLINYYGIDHMIMLNGQVMGRWQIGEIDLSKGEPPTE